MTSETGCRGEAKAPPSGGLISKLGLMARGSAALKRGIASAKAARSVISAAVDQARRSLIPRGIRAGPARTVPSAIVPSTICTSRAVCHRSSGSLARQPLIALTNGAGKSSMAGKSPRITSAMIAGWLTPPNTRFPVAISEMMSPAAKMSVRASHSLPSNCSGAM
jgi:hypothetical protein